MGCRSSFPMASAEDEKAFLRAAIDALPRVAVIVSRFPPGDQPEALDTAQRRFMDAARAYGCALRCLLGFEYLQSWDCCADR